MESEIREIAAVQKNDLLSDFGIKRGFAYFYGESENDIVNVKFRISDNQSEAVHDRNDKTPDYWGVV